ncbi:MAG TPA: hypothetical protein VGW40_12020, partial [Allosphingosinicella sp.]|nr:hypothetical protein [Allosphingosinicella sp.]
RPAERIAHGFEGDVVGMGDAGAPGRLVVAVGEGARGAVGVGGGRGQPAEAVIAIRDPPPGRAAEAGMEPAVAEVVAGEDVAASDRIEAGPLGGPL